jgi:ribonuclease HII
MPSGEPVCRVGVDENGLGARVGPLVVTAVLADVSALGEVVLARPLRGKIRADLGDSKLLVSHSNVALGEAWARVLTGDSWQTPQALFEHLSLESSGSLRQACPRQIETQCWGVAEERFDSSAELRGRLSAHVARLSQRGIDVRRVLVSITCTQRLNAARRAGSNRFLSDLHAMETLLRELRQVAGKNLVATCGKVGGMQDYSRFFGPLSGHLHSALLVSKKRSDYYFPTLGQVSFVQDADARDPLVMLASLVGKYVRELLMARISRFHALVTPTEPTVSGYHDSRTDGWVKRAREPRHALRIVDDCFERARDVS